MMPSLLAGTVQPPALTLLSTDGVPALSPLWRVRTASPSSSSSSASSSKGPSRSAVQVLKDTAYPRAEGRSVSHVPKHARGGNIAGQVVHLQSPRVGGALIEIDAVGAELGWLGAQVKMLGRRPWAMEAEVRDGRGRRGRIRFETARKEPSLLAQRRLPLLRLPLEMPEGGVTEWRQVVVHLAPLIGLFRTLKADEDKEKDPEKGERDREGGRERKRPKVTDWHDLPEGRLASVESVRIYANCRVRRVWLSNEGGVRDEWELVAAR